MAWQYLPLIYRVLSPIHIGYRSIGIIDRTRYYVPAKNFWAAVTASLTPQLYSPPRAIDYRTVGELVQRHLRFTYFFPAARLAEKPSADLRFYLPEYREGHTVYLEYPDKQEADVEAIFVSSYISTGLDHDRHAAADRLLHEVEYLQPYAWIQDNCWETYLVGGVWVAPGADPIGVEVRKEGKNVLVNNQPAFDRLTVGGERGYGFGRLELSEDNTDCLGLGNWEVQGDGPTDLLVVPPERTMTILAHVKYESGRDYEGLLEPVVGREWDAARGAGRLLSQGIVCVAPGGRYPASAYAVEGQGLWSAMP